MKKFDSKQKTQKTLEDEKLVSQRIGKNHRPPLTLIIMTTLENKIMTTLENCVKYHFAAPLNDEEHEKSAKEEFKVFEKVISLLL